MARMLSLSALFAVGATAALTGSAAAQSGEVNIYTTREPGLIQPLLDEFSKETNIKANAIFVKEGLVERVRAEGANSPADLLLVVDIGNATDLVAAGVTQPITSKLVEETVPANLRGTENQWTALTTRARVIYASKDRVAEKAMTYEELADPKWKGKLCIRSGKHPYNTALIAAFIAKHGEAKTEEWLKGVKANLARKAGGGDRDVARDVLAGICDVGVANSYYVGLMRSGKGGDEQVKWGEAIKVILPTFSDNAGSHVNVSAAAIAKNAPNKENAVKLLDFMLGHEAQDLYAKANFEYPVAADAPVDPIIASFGKLKADSVPLDEISKHRKAAADLVDKVGFDN
ncbi:iron ABC transporter substrate-binding protein [Agaricicola taiwanensis]|uniref:Iron ABC transporter substrate-binding protein n=1 Tax=Agaricicola taiwanensis TaxID=591372 RepID=A0A8J2VP83_9RHOB|nr:Fe(3+) ABC transporter substrate-binding protein [Agaricicola taiwanensis]GGE33965.1 iron ABC transporter substrate-binding protein [Agaricicola taiwanensis]